MDQELEVLIPAAVTAVLVALARWAADGISTWLLRRAGVGRS